MNIQRSVVTLVALLRLCSSINAMECETTKNNVDKYVTLPRYGILKGSMSKTTWTERSIYQFLGVRYAKSPSGNRRFKAPVPVKPWKCIQDVKNCGRKCPVLDDLAAMSEYERRTSDLEDCLNMSIYSPNLLDSLPVMVYVHGGTFSRNNADQFPPNYLLERDIILVVVQYRLDALGFLSTNSNDIPGNVGLMDVQLALTFVKENIRYFGGNPNSVTLFGQSSGAAMVSALTISPAVPQNLFHRVIIQSGSVFSRWSVTTDPVKDARDIAQAAGLYSTLPIAILNRAFMRMDVFDLLKAVDRYQSNVEAGPLKLGARSLSIGGPYNLLPDLPQEIVASPRYNKAIPMIIGTTKDDGSYVATVLYDFLLASTTANGLKSSRASIVSVIMDLICTFLNATGDKCESLQNLLSSTFWTNEELESNEIANIMPGMIDLLGMFIFKVPALQLALTNAIFNQTTFMYTFDYQGEKTRFGYEEDTSQYPFEGGVAHSDDLIYLFPHPKQVTNLNPADTQMAHQLIDLWTSFASTGQPQTIRSGLDNEFTWAPMISGTFGPYARIDKKSTLGKDYPIEFVRNVSEKKKTDYEPLISMLLN